MNVRGLVPSARRAPEWVTPEIAHEMALQVQMACAEAGYPNVEAYPLASALWDGEAVNYGFRGAPDDVLKRAGELVEHFWHAKGYSFNPDDSEATS